MHWLIATDLDGTLLDDGYRLEAAAAAIDALFRLRPVAAGLVKLHVVLATSKTFVEAVTLAGHCACDPVLAFENGAGLAWRTVACAARGTARRDGYEIECPGMDYARLRHALLRLRRHADFDFRGFGDMSAAEVGARTGLAEEAAAAAKQRMASEALLWQGSPAALEAFRAELANLGWSLERGGRFHPVTRRAGSAGRPAARRRTGSRRIRATRQDWKSPGRSGRR